MLKFPVWSMLLLLLAARGLSAGGWHEQGAGSLLTVSEEWGVERLEIDGGFFDIEYRGGRGPAVRLEIYGPADERPLVERYGELLQVSLPERLRFGTLLRGRVVLYGPAVMDLAVRTGTGAVTVTTVSDSWITVTSESGDISLESLDANLVITSGAGNVTVASSLGIKGIDTEVGNITVYTSEGDMRLRSLSGRISLWDVAGAIDVKTESGPIEVVGILLRDEGRVESDSGRIEVIVTNNLQDITFELHSETGTIQFGDEVYAGRLTVGEGPIGFVGISGSGNQQYR